MRNSETVRSIFEDARNARITMMRRRVDLLQAQLESIKADLDYTPGAGAGDTPDYWHSTAGQEEIRHAHTEARIENIQRTNLLKKLAEITCRIDDLRIIMFENQQTIEAERASAGEERMAHIRNQRELLAIYRKQRSCPTTTSS